MVKSPKNAGAFKRRSRLAWVSVAYTSLFTFWLLLRLIFFDRFWPLALINSGAEFLFIPLPFLLGAILWQRRWRWLAPLALPGLVALILFGELFLPPLPGRAPTLPAGSPRLTAMSFNVLWSNTDVAAIARAVRAQSPDIVGFEELHTINAEAINNLLKTDYPYNTFSLLTQVSSVGLLSRYPIESAEAFPLPPRNLAIRTVVNFNGQRIQVFVVHLSPNNFGLWPLDEFVAAASERYASRAGEAARLAEIITPITEPLILLCDCNLTDTSEAYAHLASFMRDSFREVGWGLGHSLIHPPYHFRTVRLDYVWHNDRWAAIEAEVGPEGGSDHLPITAQLALTPQ